MNTQRKIKCEKKNKQTHNEKHKKPIGYTTPNLKHGNVLTPQTKPSVRKNSQNKLTSQCTKYQHE